MTALLIALALVLAFLCGVAFTAAGFALSAAAAARPAAPTSPRGSADE